jgi:hypothetical protein
MDMTMEQGIEEKHHGLFIKNGGKLTCVVNVECICENNDTFMHMWDHIDIQLNI